MLDTCRRAITAAAALTVALPVWLQQPAMAQPSVLRTEASGTAFRITLSDGSIKQGADLAGAALVFNIAGKPLRVRIAGITFDHNDRAVLLRDFRIDSAGAPLCRPGPDGLQAGFPLAGRTAADGRFVEAEPGAFELICTSGAQGKCVRFGYHPWEKSPDGGLMRDYYNACVRMVRADYAGDGRGWTRDGTLIDIWDDRGIQTKDAADDPTLSFEAGWTAEGAVCIAHTRIPENITIDRLKAAYPRFTTVQTCDVAAARAAGALLFNRSR
jgi:ADYC domain